MEVWTESEVENIARSVRPVEGAGEKIYLPRAKSQACRGKCLVLVYVIFNLASLQISSISTLFVTSVETSLAQVEQLMVELVAPACVISCRIGFAINLHKKSQKKAWAKTGPSWRRDVDRMKGFVFTSFASTTDPVLVCFRYTLHPITYGLHPEMKEYFQFNREQNSPQEIIVDDLGVNLNWSARFERSLSPSRILSSVIGSSHLAASVISNQGKSYINVVLRQTKTGSPGQKKKLQSFVFRLHSSDDVILLICQ